MVDRVVATSAVVMLLAACGPEPSPSPPPSPQPAVVLYVNHHPAPITIAAPVDLGGLVNVAVFGAFRPDMTIAEARQRFGPPARQATDHRGTFYVYRLDGGEVAVAHLTASSVGASWEDWSIYAYPRETHLAAVFRGALLEHLQRQRINGEIVLVVRSAAGEERVSARLSGDNASELRWYLTS